MVALRVGFQEEGRCHILRPGLDFKANFRIGFEVDFRGGPRDGALGWGSSLGLGFRKG